MRALKSGPTVLRLAFHVEDAQAVAGALVEKGLRIIQTCKFPKGQYVYLDATDQLGLQIELLQYDA